MHRRRSTEERIALAVDSSRANFTAESEESKEETEQDWACLECTFINAPLAKACAMCFHPRPDLDQAPSKNVSDTFVAQPSVATVTSNMMYGNVPPPAASQVKKREAPKKQVAPGAHRRMTTEEQITLAIQQSTSNDDDEELFQKAGKKNAVPAHKRMTTAEQINQAIMMSQTNNEEVQASSGVGAVEPLQQGHKRMNTEEQIASAINETVAGAPEEKMTDEDLINAAIANMGIGEPQKPQRGHQRVSTEEQIKQAIFMSTGEEDTFVTTGAAPAAMPFHYGQQDQQYLQQVVENPENYGTFEPPRGVDLDPRGLHMVKFILSALNDKKQEINKLRLQLNQERVNNRDLRYELEIVFDKYHKIEEKLEKKEQELQDVISKQSENFVEKAAVIEPEEDTFVVVEETSQKQRYHQKAPSYGGIRELFMDGGDVNNRVKKNSEHARDPTYGGIREMFQDANQIPDQIAENQNAVTSLKKTHEREPSYVGMTELFARPAEDQPNNEQATQGHEQAKQESRQQESVGQHHTREPSYGGIRDMFTTPEDLEESGKEEEDTAVEDSSLSYGGIRQMFVEEDDKIGHKEDIKEEQSGQESELTDTLASEKEQVEQVEENFADTFEEVITASYDVIWNLLVEKVHHPEKYLPVEDVAVEHRDGKWVRHMFLTPTELVITEEISVNEEDHVIKFVDNNYPELEIVNKLEKTEDENKQRVVFYKQNKDTGIKISSSQLTQMFTTDVHFLKVRASQKMGMAAHAREPSYGGVASLFGDGHGRSISYGAVGDTGGMNFVIGQQDAAMPKRGAHSREMSYGGIRAMFESNDKPNLMARLQEEVFKVMDSYQWSEITKGMVVQEVEKALGFELKPYHKRFIKITIMRIIDGRLKLECFAGETVKKEVVELEKTEDDMHKRDTSYGGIKAQGIGENEKWQIKAVELDELYTKAQEKELDQLYDKAQTYSQSAQAVVSGGFKAKSKIHREHEKEVVRRTQRHSRNVSYGGVRYSEEDPAHKILDDIGPEVHLVENSGYAEKLETLNTKVEKLTEENGELKLLTENMTNSKIILVQTCSNEIERLRQIISSFS